MGSILVNHAYTLIIVGKSLIMTGWEGEGIVTCTGMRERDSRSKIKLKIKLKMKREKRRKP